MELLAERWTDLDHLSAGAVARHQVARLSSGVVLIELRSTLLPYDEGDTELVLNGEPVPQPVCSLSLEGASSRLLLVARWAGSLLGAPCALWRGARPIGTFFLDPLTPAATLLLRRDRAERDRVLRFLTESCAPLLDADANAELASLCLALARSVAGGGTPAARAISRPDAQLSLWDVAAVPGASQRGQWRLISSGGIRLVASPVSAVLTLEGPLPPRAMVLPPAPIPPFALSAAPPSQAGPAAVPPALPELLRHAFTAKAGATARRALAALGQRAGEDQRCATLLREAQLLVPARPRVLDEPLRPIGGALELALSDGEGGLFLAGWTRDPLGLLAGLEVRSPFATHPLQAGALHRVPRPDLTKRFADAPHGGAGTTPGFLAHLPAADPQMAVAQWRLGLRLASGETIELVAPPGVMPPASARDRVLRSVHPGAARPELIDGCIGPAATRLHRAAMAAGGRPDVLTIGGSRPPQPRCTVVIPLYRVLHFLRFQIGAFARDPGFRSSTELVFVLDSPEQRQEVEHLLRGLAMLHELPMTLVVQPEHRGYASACNAGAAVAAAPVLLLLNSDVVPIAPGWLARLLMRLARSKRLAAIGPKLLFDDGSIQHAGLLFRMGEEEWFNDHYFKGFPRDYEPANQARRVPGVTGAALCVRRDAFEAVGGLSTDYIIGDYEDSDLCLRLRVAGHEIAYEPSAELFHFERQSIRDHAGYARTLASTMNRRLHHSRWHATIEALMRRFPAS